MARGSWSRLAPLLFTVALVGMVVYHKEFFAAEEAATRQRDALAASKREVDTATKEVEEEVASVKAQLQDALAKAAADKASAAATAAEIKRLAERVAAAGEAAKTLAEQAKKLKAAVPAAAAPASSAVVAAPPPPANPKALAAAAAVDTSAADAAGVAAYDFAGTAVVTLATGNSAARGAIALVQSLRDTETRVQDIVVLLARGGMGSPECHDPAWKQANKREGVNCGGSDTIAEEIISPQYTATLRKLRATLLVVNEIPSTRYTEGIPGGRSTFWGMALNKLHVFNLTQYRKVLWMDGDTLVLKNVDHLFLRPMGTMAFTYACCNQNGPAIPSGGLWVMEPSVQLGVKMWQMMSEGKPSYTNSGDPIMGADGKIKREYWHWGDMQLVRWYFSKWDLKPKREALWPRIDDVRHGVVDGQRFFPGFADATEEKFRKDAMADRWDSTPLSEGWVGGDSSVVLGENQMGEMAPMWRALDARYDQCVGSCECLPERDMPNTFFSVHFSCIHHVHKPSGYDTETAFIEDLRTNAKSCTRYYFHDLWYEKFSRAHGRLPGPWTGAKLPIWDTEHDKLVESTRKRLIR